MDYIANTNFYRFISKLFSSNESLKSIENVKDSSEFHTRSKSIENLSTENNSNNRWNTEKSEINRSKIGKYFDNEPTIAEEIKNNESYLKTYLAITALIITASLCWYYSDEIRTGAMSVYDWINTFRPGGGTNGGDNNPGINNATVVDPNQPIELIDNTKGKSKVLSPSQSIDDLNNQAKLTWADFTKAPDSPSSTDSNITITPESSKIKDPTTIASSSKLTLDTTASVPKSDQPGSALGEAAEKFWSDWVKKHWKESIPNEIKNHMNYIENIIDSDTLTDQEHFQAISYFYRIIRDFNEEVKISNIVLENDPKNYEAMKQTTYYFREWIVNYNEKVLAQKAINIELGTINDSPKLIENFY